MDRRRGRCWEMLDFFSTHQVRVTSVTSVFLMLLAFIIYLNFNSLSDFVQNCVDLCTKFPKWYRLWAGPHLAIFLNRPELVEMVLKSPHALDKGPMYRVFTIVIGGDGLFNSAGIGGTSINIIAFLYRILDRDIDIYMFRQRLAQPSQVSESHAAALFVAGQLSAVLQSPSKGIGRNYGRTGCGRRSD